MKETEKNLKKIHNDVELNEANQKIDYNNFGENYQMKDTKENDQRKKKLSSSENERDQISEVVTKLQNSNQDLQQNSEIKNEIKNKEQPIELNKKNSKQKIDVPLESKQDQLESTISSNLNKGNNQSTKNEKFEIEEQLNDQELMQFDNKPKKLGKKPQLTDKRKPKEEIEQIDQEKDLNENNKNQVEINQQDQEQLMQFDSEPKKIGKKPILTDKRKPKDEIINESDQNKDQDALMQFENEPKGKKPTLTDKKKQTEDITQENQNKDKSNPQDELLQFDNDNKKIGKKPILTDKRKNDEIIETNQQEELIQVDIQAKKVGKKPVLTDKKQPKEEEMEQNNDTQMDEKNELLQFDNEPKKVAKKPVLTDKRKPKDEVIPEQTNNEKNDQEELMNFDNKPTKNKPVLTDKKKKEDINEVEGNKNDEQLLQFDNEPKKGVKKPVLTDKKKPKEELIEIVSNDKPQNDQNEIMEFNDPPKKVGKKPVLTDKRKPKEDEIASNDNPAKNDQNEIMEFNDPPKKIGKKPVLTDKRKPKEDEIITDNPPKNDQNEIIEFNDPPKVAKKPVLTDKRKPKEEPIEITNDQPSKNDQNELMDFNDPPKKVAKKPVLTDKRKPKEELGEAEPKDELMEFNDPPKKVAKKPVLTDKRKPKEEIEGGEKADEQQDNPSIKKVAKKPQLTNKKKTTDAEGEKQEEKPIDNQPKPVDNNTPNDQAEPEPQTKGYNFDFDKMKDAFPPGQLPDGINPDEMNQEVTLDQKIKSSNLKEKLEGLQEMMKWQDPNLTKEMFLQGIHLTIKERDNKALNLIIQALENLLQDKNIGTLLEKINIPKFLEGFTEKCMDQSKGPTKKKVIEFIPKFWKTCKEGNVDMLANLKTLFKSIKPKIQENTLLFLAELVKEGFLLDLDLLNDFWEQIEKATQSRTKGIQQNAIQIYKEFYYYMPADVKPHMEKLKKEQAEELQKFFDSIDPKNMKQLSTGGKDGGAPIDTFDIQKEQDMPAEYSDNKWVDKVMEEPAWKEKERLMNEFCLAMKPIKKLNAKTKVFMFVDLFKQCFAQSMVMLKIDACKVFEVLADRLRKNMRQEARQTFPLMLADLKIKNKQLQDQIFKTSEKFFLCLNLEDMLEDIQENLQGKNVEKQAHILTLVLNMLKKSKLVDTPQNAKKIGKMVKSCLDSSDAKVREASSKIVAQLMDTFTDPIKSIMNDLNNVKMNKILKHCQNPELKVEITELEPETKQQGGQPVTQQESKQKPNQQQDKSAKIRAMKENLFSNNQVKITDVGAFSKFLEQNLKSLSDLTKDFKELNASCCKEIYELISEIAQKVQKQSLVQYSREQITKFYIEVIVSNKSSEEIYDSIQTYLNSKNGIVSTRQFLMDVFAVVSEKNINVTRELMNIIVRLMEEKLAKRGTLQSISHKNWLEFLKTHFSNTTVHVSIKTVLVNLMRTIQKKFGEKVLKDYPGPIYKDYETQNKEIEKQFTKLLDKLTGSVEKKGLALAELSKVEDITKLSMYWSNKQFIIFLKQAIKTEKSPTDFKSLTKILQNYVELFNTSKNDFSHSSYLQIFEVIISKYYDQDKKSKDLDDFQHQSSLSNLQIKAAVEDIFNKTVAIISPTTLLNNMISDTNSMQWIQQILCFYLQYGSEIEVNTKFIDYIVQIIKKQKTNDSEIKTLVDNSLLMLKNTENDQIIIRGDEVKPIREVWQKKEEDVLFEERFIKGFKIFEDISFYNSAKTFIESQLKFDGVTFNTKDLSMFPLSIEDEQLKIKLAYYYIRSIENITFLAEKIFDEIRQLDINHLTHDLCLIILKILFNLLKNNFPEFEEIFYQEIKTVFLDYFQFYGEDYEELAKTLEMTRQEKDFLICVLQNAENLDVNQDTSAINSPRKRTHQNDISYTRTPVLNKPYRDEDPFRSNQKPSIIDQQKPRALSPHSKISQASFTKPNLNQSVINQEDLQLNDVIEKMWSFELEEFEAATVFFNDKLQSEQGKRFLQRNIGKIIDTFTGIINKIFEEGINFELDRESYQLIFNPLEGISQDPNLLNFLDQDKLNEFVNQLLLRLVTANQEKLSLQNGEQRDDVEQSLQEQIELANFIMKSFNSLMLKVIRNLDSNHLLQSLFTIIINCCQGETDDVSIALYNLCFKCLMKFNKDSKKSSTSIDPSEIFRLIYQFMNVYQNYQHLPNNMKTVEGLLKNICQKYDTNYIVNCYNSVFGIQNKIPFIWNVIDHYQKKGGGGNMGGIEREDLKNLLISKIRIINGQNNFNNLPYQTQEIMEILRQDPNMRFENYAQYFQDRNFFEYIKKQVNLQLYGGIQSQYQSQSRLQNFDDHSQWDNSRIEGNSMYRYQR